jgi:hypothetical protein
LRKIESVSLAINPSRIPIDDQTLASTLRRPNGLGGGWGPISTVLLGALSFGALPLLAWPIRMRDLFAGEAARFVEISRFTVPDPTWPHRLSLMRAARRTAPIALFWVLPVFFATFVLAAGAVMMLGEGPRSFDHLVRMTYVAGQSASLDDPLALLKSVVGIWSAVLILGYLIHFVHVQAHFSAVRRFLIRFNAVLVLSGVHTVPLPRRSVIPGIVWLAAGVVMTTFGAWWAVPMVLAGSYQRRDAYRMHRDLGKVLADRVEVLSLVKMTPDLRCQTPRCHALLRPDARFCPRCGSAVNPLVAAGSVWA